MPVPVGMAALREAIEDGGAGHFALGGGTDRTLADASLTKVLVHGGGASVSDALIPEAKNDATREHGGSFGNEEDSSGIDPDALDELGRELHKAAHRGDVDEVGPAAGRLTLETRGLGCIVVLRQCRGNFFNYQPGPGHHHDDHQVGWPLLGLAEVCLKPEVQRLCTYRLACVARSCRCAALLWRMVPPSTFASVALLVLARRR